MNGEIAQLVALAVHGSAWLASGFGDPPTFTGNSAFQFVHSLEFQWTGSPSHGPSRADGTADWLEQFKRRDGRGLLLSRRPVYPCPDARSYDLAAFANGGECALRGVTTRGGEEWSARWSVDADISLGRKPQPPDHRIWDVLYKGQAANVPEGVDVNLAVTQAYLEGAIRAARDFAGVEGWTAWVDRLDKALDVARSDKPRQPYHEDLLLPATPLEASRLLATASQAWVFGGMGWWNDEYPERHTGPEFDAVAALLYDAVLSGVVSASNAAAAAAGLGN